MAEFIACMPRQLPSDKAIPAASTAVRINPVNNPPVERIASLAPQAALKPAFIAALTTKYWHNKRGVRLTVGFMDSSPADLRARIVSHLNAWGTTGNVVFTESNTDPQVRIAREGGEMGGYWSYLGTDILHIEPDQPTMNLEAFTMQTPDEEFHRVVRHEAGHTLGFPHEHMRKDLVARIDVQKAITLFTATQGWSEAEVRAQVLTPLEERSLIGTPADQMSIMCYQLPGSITTDGQPIVGGLDIDESDYEFVARLYPKDPAPTA
ncbi:MAG: M12 family metallopeptidase [Acidimicrobiales bacterium]